MTRKVLIVEDNELNMKLFEDLLMANNCEVFKADDGRKVLDIAHKNKPDLILMDIQLPEVSGLEVTAWIRDDDELKHIPVVAVTAFAMKGDEEKMLDGGCQDYISKPISVMEFIRVVNKYLDK